MAACPQPLDREIYCIGDPIQRAVYTISHISIFVIYQPDNTSALQPVNIPGPGIGLLSYGFGLFGHL
jgi:hypothetical protein